MSITLYQKLLRCGPRDNVVPGGPGAVATKRLHRPAFQDDALHHLPRLPPLQVCYLLVCDLLLACSTW